MSNIYQNPKFMILEANPAKYINNISSTVLMLIRAGEGIAASFLLYKVWIALAGLVSGTHRGMLGLIDNLLPNGAGIAPGSSPMSITVGTIVQMLPEELQGIVMENMALDTVLSELLQRTFLPGGYDMNVFMTVGTFENIMCAAALVAFLLVLAAIAIEAIAFIMIRFVHKGSGMAKTAHRIIFYAVIAIMIAVFCLSIIFVLKCRKAGIIGALLSGRLRTAGILMIVLLVFLGFRVFYHRDVSKVLSAVDYEIRLGFKEMFTDGKHLTRGSLIFVLLSIVAAVLIYIRTGTFFSGGTAICVILAIKYIAVYVCWCNFRLCHM